MKTLTALVLLGTLGVLPGFGQSEQSETQTLQAILVELRGIHNDVRLSQTTQILLAEMQMQQNVVSKAQQKRDDLKTTVEQLQNQQKSVALQVAQFDERLSSSGDPAQKQQLVQIQSQMKAELPNLKNQEQERSNDLADAENRLTREQDALSNIQDQMNAVVKKLQPAGSQ